MRVFEGQSVQLGDGFGGAMALDGFQIETAQRLQGARGQGVAGEDAGLPGVEQVGGLGRLTDGDARAAGGQQGQAQEQARATGAMRWSLLVRGTRTDPEG